MIKLHWSNSKLRWKDSITVSLALLATLQTIAEVSGFLDLDCINSIPWLWKLAIIFAIFIFLTVCTFILKHLLVHKGLKLSIGDNEVKIKQADIFEQDGWRLIPFNEMFDTVVDDIIIAHHSLNGYFIDTYVKNDLKKLEQCIETASDVKGLNPTSRQGRKKFPLGRIIPYNNEYLLLAFTHFDDNNNAFLSHADFEKCLITMWKEINRVYANRPIYIPLLGFGITRFTDTPHKDNLSLAKCLLCTLKMSGVHIKQPITICLMPEVMNSMNIYELKSK